MRCQDLGAKPRVASSPLDSGSWLVFCYFGGAWNDHNCLLHFSVHHPSPFTINITVLIHSDASDDKGIFKHLFAVGEKMPLYFCER